MEPTTEKSVGNSSVIENAILEIVAELADEDRRYIKQGMRLKEDLGLESMDMLDLQFQVENAIRRPLDNATINSWKTVGDLLKLANT